MGKSSTELSNFLGWVELEKAPPGPPPRSGLKWKEETHRWIRPKDESSTDPESSFTPYQDPLLSDDAVPDYHSASTLSSELTQGIHSHIQSFQPVFETAMESFEALFEDDRVTVQGRIKTVESIAGKLSKKGYDDISKVSDIIGTRLECGSHDQIEGILMAIADNFTVTDIEEHDLKDGYYSATHLTLDIDDKAVEVQVRTSSFGRIASYAHDTVYKQAENLKNDPGLIDATEEYLSDWGSFIGGKTSDIMPPDCPPPIRIVIGCLEDVTAESPSSKTGGEPGDGAEKMEKAGIPFKSRVLSLVNMLTAPTGKYRLVEVDEFSDPFETGETLNDFVFLDMAQKEKASMVEQNPTVKYFIYDEDAKIVG